MGQSNFIEYKSLVHLLYDLLSRKTTLIDALENQVKLEHIWHGNDYDYDGDDADVKRNNNEFDNSLHYLINGRILVLHEVEGNYLGLYKYTPKGINVNREIKGFKNEIKIELNKHL